MHGRAGLVRYPRRARASLRATRGRRHRFLPLYTLYVVGSRRSTLRCSARWRRATILTTPGSWLWCSCYTFPCSLPDANRSEVVFHGPPPAIQTLGVIPTSLEFPILVVMSARRQCDNPGLRTRDGRLDPPPPRGASWKPWGQPRGPRVGHCRRESTRTCPCPLPCP